MHWRGVAAAVVLALGVACPAALAQDPGGPVGEGIVEQSCKSLLGGTAGTPQEVPSPTPTSLPATWNEAPPGLLPDRVFFRTQTESFNRLYEFAARNGTIYARLQDGAGPWRELPLPACFAGHVSSIAVDDDELIALDDARRIFTMDNALKDPLLFNWTSRWGTPFWTGLGYTLPGPLRAWSWSVVSPLEDGTWTDPAGNRTAIGSGKVSHIWGLREDGQHLTFWDPWLPPDQSYEMCGPHRGRFKAVNMSASGSYIFEIGNRGDMFTREYDFDLSGHDQLFFQYSYDDQRGKGDGAPIQLPPAPWIEQPKIPGTITSTISIHKVGSGSIHRILRVEGVRGGKTGYWERDVADPRVAGWTFHETGLPLSGRKLKNPRRDTSAVRLGPSEDRTYRMSSDGTTATLQNYNVYCSPARLTVTENGQTRNLLLHSIDGLRQQARARGLDDVPREQYGAIESPDGKFSKVTVEATKDQIVLKELGWKLDYVPPRRKRHHKHHHH